MQRKVSVNSFGGHYGWALSTLETAIIDSRSQKDLYMRYGREFFGDIILGNHFLVATGLDVKDFLE